MEKKFVVITSGALVFLFVLFAFMVLNSRASVQPISISEVAFKEEGDFVELHINSPDDYADYELYEGATRVALLADLGMMQENDRILIHEEDGPQGQESPGVHHIYGMGGLTGTDNVLRLLDPFGNTVDALIWSNNNGVFTGNIAVANTVVENGMWFAPNAFSKSDDFGAWIDSDDISNGFSLNRIENSYGIFPEDYDVKPISPGVVEINSAPVAECVGPDSIMVDEHVIFSAESSFDADNDDLIISWFLDGVEYADGVESDFVFSSEGEHQIECVAVDPHGAIDRMAVTVVVEPIEIESYNTQLSISEILPNPDGSDAIGEFIELVNNGSNQVNLEGYLLTDGSTRYSLPYLEVGSGEYAVFYRDKTKIALNNSGDSVSLFTPNNELIASVSYTQAGEGLSFALFDDEYKWTLSSTPLEPNILQGTDMHIEEDLQPEKGIAVGGPDQADFPTGVIINEIMINPVGADEDGEWIELKNISPIDINLYGFILDDEEAGSKPFTLPSLTISPGAFAVFDRATTKIQLNNSEDSVRLLAPDGKLIDAVRYTDKAPEGVSFARQENASWKWTGKSTKGAENEIVPIQKEAVRSSKVNKQASSSAKKSLQRHSVSLQAALELNKGELVEVGGVVTVAPGMVAKRSFYIQDVSGNAHIYKSKDEVPQLEIGQRVRLKGKISETKDGKRILLQGTSDIEVVEQLADYTILNTPFSNLSEQNIAAVVEIAGEMKKREGNMLYLYDGEMHVPVYITKGSGLKAKDFNEGDMMRVTGVLLQRGGSIAVHPRGDFDIHTEDAHDVLDTGILKGDTRNTLRAVNHSDELYIGLAIIFAAVCLAVVYKMRQKQA